MTLGLLPLINNSIGKYLFTFRSLQSIAKQVQQISKRKEYSMLIQNIKSQAWKPEELIQKFQEFFNQDDNLCSQTVDEQVARIILNDQKITKINDKGKDPIAADKLS